MSFTEIEDHPDYELDYMKQEKCFIVKDKKTGEKYHFTRKSGGRLYIYTLTMNANLMTTVEERKKLYMKRQLKEADRVRDLLILLWFLTLAKYKRNIQKHFDKGQSCHIGTHCHHGRHLRHKH